VASIGDDKVILNSKDGKTVASIGDEELVVDIQAVSDNRISLLIGHRSFDVYVAREEVKRHVHIEGNSFCFSTPEAEEGYNAQSGTGGEEAKLILSAPMPGSVIKINVSEGDGVEEGQCLAIVEAMKMETGLHSTITGRVKKVLASQGQQINAGEVIIELEEK
jgi:biotin carboxyl carrier protein